jgi:hypothetical protein
MAPVRSAVCCRSDDPSGRDRLRWPSWREAHARLAPDDHWGVDGSTRLASFVQQLVYTASEEPGIVRVLITPNGGATAIIGGEGLVIDHPATRADVSGG